LQLQRLQQQQQAQGRTATATSDMGDYWQQQQAAAGQQLWQWSSPALLQRCDRLRTNSMQ
jgi:hypothetical protein